MAYAKAQLDWSSLDMSFFYSPNSCGGPFFFKILIFSKKIFSSSKGYRSDAASAARVVRVQNSDVVAPRRRSSRARQALAVSALCAASPLQVSGAVTRLTVDRGAPHIFLTWLSAIAV